MKRLAALLIVLAVAVCGATALAEGELSVVQENFHVVGSSSLYGYLYMRVQNTGDAPVRIDGGEMEILDPDGNVLASTTTLWRFAEYVQPGESTYVYFNQRIDGIESADQVGDYRRTVNCKESTDKVSLRLPIESKFEDDVEEGYWTYDYMTSTVTNDFEQNAFDVTMVRALLDGKGNILFIDSDNLYNYKAITPGSSLVLRRSLNTNFTDYFAANGYVPATVDGIAYMNVSDPTLFTRPGEAPAQEQAPEAATEAGTEATEAEATEAPAAYPTLKRGSKGEDVTKLQQRLKDLGYLTGKVDGDFGKGTEKAVTDFQGKAGLAQTGVADEATQLALFAQDAPAAQ